MMPNTFPFCPSRFRIWLLPLLSSLLLTACPLGPEGIGSDAPLRNADYFLQAAKIAQGDRANLMKLSAAELLINEARFDEATSVLDGLRGVKFSERDLQRYTLAYADALVNVKRARDALVIIDNLSNPERLSKNDYARWMHLRADALLQDAQPFAAAAQLVQLQPLLNDDKQVQNGHRLWDILSVQSVSQLEQHRASQSEFLLSGWTDLALLHARYASMPDALKGALNSWRLQFSQHPANAHLPDELLRAQLAERKQINRVAVLLPLTGRLASSGRAIRDGIMAAYYETRDTGWSLHFYDTVAADVLPLYQQAVQEGADAIIGPLGKEQLQQVLSLGDLPVLTLAMNTLDNVQAQNFYQFGLPIEDDAAQVAQRAIAQHKRALVVTGDDANSERAYQALTQAFTALQGEVVGGIKLGKDDTIEASITSALGIDQSRLRQQKLAQTLGKELSFQPRRRQDLDVIFLATRPQTAMFARAFLNHHFANDVPVYATSMIYSGQPNPQKDKDLNGIEFCDAPWLIDFSEAQMDARKTLTAALPNASGAQARLFALGHDALLVLPEIGRLLAFPEFRIEGFSGALYINDQGQIKRELSWARFRDGRVWTLPAPVRP